MEIIIKLDEMDSKEVEATAKRLDISTQSVIENLKNVYLSNLSDDLSWVEECMEGTI